MNEIAIAMMLGALWRVIDGRSWSPNGWNVLLWTLLPVYSVHALGWWGLWTGLITIGNILAGYKLEVNHSNRWYVLEARLTDGWHDWAMWMRFSSLSFIAVLPFITSSSAWMYIGASVFAGFMFPFTTWLRKKGYVSYTHWVNEAILGATVIGGLSWLGL